MLRQGVTEHPPHFRGRAGRFYEHRDTKTQSFFIICGAFNLCASVSLCSILYLYTSLGKWKETLVKIKKIRDSN